MPLHFNRYKSVCHPFAVCIMPACSGLGSPRIAKALYALSRCAPILRYLNIFSYVQIGLTAFKYISNYIKRSFDHSKDYMRYLHFYPDAVYVLVSRSTQKAEFSVI